MKKITSVLLVILILFASAVTASAAPSETGTMRLTDISGKVTVKNASGVALKAAEGMPLYNGYTVGTDIGGSARVDMTAGRELILGRNCICTVRLSGKTAEAFISAGTVYFSTDGPLAADEAFVLRTDAFTGSVRGSSGWVNPERLGQLTGKSLIFDSGKPTIFTGQPEQDDMPSGLQIIQGGTLVRIGQDSLSLIPMTPEDVPGVAAAAVASDPEKLEALGNVPGFDTQVLVGGLGRKQADEESAAQAQLQTADSAISAQTAAVSTAVNYPSGSSAYTETARADGGGTPSGGPSPGSSEGEGSTVTNPSDTRALMAALSGGSATLDPNGWTISYTGVTVGAGQTLNIAGSGTVSMPDLTIEAGGTVNVVSGTTLSVSGEDLVWRGTLTNNGSVQNRADIALLGTVINNGTFTNAGTLAVAPGASFTGGTVSNSGTVTGSGTFSPGACDGVVIRN